ncbi:MAG: c-type cytochrome [Alphaproteobacteria bacterium]|nr:c-type cytochrome [Alphaproteobacteria bacterium]
MLLQVSAATMAEGASLPPAGASACSGCHAANTAGTLVPSLLGRNPVDIEAAMRDFRNGSRPATVMDRIAKGFTDDEVKAIAAWYGAIKP